MRNSFVLFTAVSLAVGGLGALGCNHGSDPNDRDMNHPNRTTNSAAPGTPMGDGAGRYPSGSPSNVGGDIPTVTPGVTTGGGPGVPNAPAGTLTGSPAVSGPPTTPVPPGAAGTGGTATFPGAASGGVGAGGAGPGTVAPAGVGVTGSGTGIGSGTGTGATTPGGPSGGGK